MSKTPTPLKPEQVKEILIDTPQLQQRVRELGAAITRAYTPAPLTLLCLLKGALPFTADLMRAISLPLRLECLRVASYGKCTTSSGSPDIRCGLETNLSGQHVLIVDDILDTGATLSCVLELLKAQNCASLRTCVLLDKKRRRITPLKADLVGFTIPDHFVVGYGLDQAEQYRNLSYIAITTTTPAPPPSHSAQQTP